MQGCEVSVEWTKKINKLADAMNSNMPVNALRPGNEQWNVSRNT